MVTIGALWLAIILSASGVWIASAIVWILLPHHRSDYRAVPDEEAARAALTAGITPGQYNIPHMTSRSELKNPEALKKFEDGPIGFLTILPRGVPSTARGMVLSLIYYLIVGLMVAYVASRTMAAGADYLAVFRITATVAWLCHGFGVIPDAIWFGRPWSAVVKHLADALVYALITGGFFGWLWPTA